MKTLAILTAASLLALAGAASAQTTAPAPSAQTAPEPARRGGLSRADLNALTDARIAGIQAGLKLNPEQQQLWAPVEQALRARAAQRADRVDDHRRIMQERLDQRGRRDGDLDITQMIDRQAEFATRRAQQVTERAQTLTALSTAMRPFYASLDENQKRLLPVLMRQGRDHMGLRHGHVMDRDGRDRGPRMGGMMDHHRMMERGRRMMDRDGMMERGRGMDRFH